MKVLVTGASGFFGTEIVARLRQAGHEVVAASRRLARGPGTELLDVASPESCQQALNHVRPEAVVHAAALAHVPPGAVSAALCRAINAGGTRNMCAASVAARVSRFVFISSVMVYGDYDLPPVARESDRCVGHGVYGQAKIAAEAACHVSAGEMDLFILRMATMYSPDWLWNIRKRVRPLSAGRPVYFTLNANSRRYSLCSRRNGAEAVLWATEKRLQPGVYNVADQYHYRQLDILRVVRSADGAGPCVHVPTIVPRMMWHAVRLTVPVSRWRANARSRYWKFCESNLYSSEKLNACGLATPPDLLGLGHAERVTTDGRTVERDRC